MIKELAELPKCAVLLSSLNAITDSVGLTEIRHSLLVTIIGWGLDLVNPVPLTPCHLHSHGAGNDLLQCIDGGEKRDDQAENQNRRDVKEQILRLHEQLVVAPDEQA